MEIFQFCLFFKKLIFTARVRSTREGNAFTGVCPSTRWGGGYPSLWSHVPTGGSPISDLRSLLVGEGGGLDRIGILSMARIGVLP